MGRAIALSDNKGDRPLGFDMGKAITLSDNKSDRPLGLGMGKGDRSFCDFGKKG
ncbi:MAG: hypothetical protein ACBR50_02255 [Microcoleus sp.]